MFVQRKAGAKGAAYSSVRPGQEEQPKVPTDWWERVARKVSTFKMVGTFHTFNPRCELYDLVSIVIKS